VTCEEVRDQLAEYLLGGLDDVTEQAIARHLRGCGASRAELASLAEGMSTFARAAHELDPPEELKDRVMSALHEERKTAPPGASPRRRRFGMLAWAAAFLAVVLFSGAVTSAVVQYGRAEDYHAAALKYEAFLGALGGENVRVGTLSSPSPQSFTGSVVLYDSTHGQSWALVLVNAPGVEGQADVTLHGGTKQIEMRPLVFESGGDASTWLVTGADLRPFDSVTIRQHGAVLATGAISRT
jgi:predicted anti-sigma-YlaC factor YlaD